MNELQTIEGFNVKVYGTQEQPMFLAKEVAELIEHTQVSKMLQGVDEEEKLMGTMFLSGQNRDTWFLTEDGLYEVLMTSRKPIAKAFKKQVKQVLKDIRKHGMYAKDEILDNPDLLIATATRLKEEKEKRLALEAENAIMQPKAVFADAVNVSNQTILVGDLAKLISQNGIQIGQNRLFRWMRENGYLHKQGSQYNRPTQRYMDQGLFKVKESSHANADGSVKLTFTTKVTGKGQQYFVNKFMNANELVEV